MIYNRFRKSCLYLRKERIVFDNKNIIFFSWKYMASEFQLWPCVHQLLRLLLNLEASKLHYYHLWSMSQAANPTTRCVPSRSAHHCWQGCQFCQLVTLVGVADLCSSCHSLCWGHCPRLKSAATFSPTWALSVMPMHALFQDFESFLWLCSFALFHLIHGLPFY